MIASHLYTVYMIVDLCLLTGKLDFSSRFVGLLGHGIIINCIYDKFISYRSWTSIFTQH